MKEQEWSVQLSKIFNCEVEFVTDLITNLNSKIKAYTGLAEGDYIYANQHSYIILSRDNNSVNYCLIKQKELTDAEVQLIQLLLIPNYVEHNKHQVKSKQNKMVLLGKWLDEKATLNHSQISLPDEFIVSKLLYNEMIPILLTEDSKAKQANTQEELDKLLKTFLSDEVIVLPLSVGEWLILAPLTLLKDDEFIDDEEQDSIEMSIANLAYGLQELLANEWIWESHLAISYPVSPVKQLVGKIVSLRETMLIGKKFHIGTNIHLQWDLQLERLLHMIPDEERDKYMEQSFRKTELFVESEMLHTLETFFNLDCNVSETAKKLYIHRNTLLYRLDKLKQETGLDVRLFRDAVLVKIIILLYKVTKT